MPKPSSSWITTEIRVGILFFTWLGTTDLKDQFLSFYKFNCNVNIILLIFTANMREAVIRFIIRTIRHLETFVSVM